MTRPSRLTRARAAALRLLPLLGGLLSLHEAQAAWTPKTPPLATQWTSQVSPTNALPEYPRPQMVRADWQNLNGEWQFGNATAGQTPPYGQTLAESILVPFPIESGLSGIKRHQDRMWYRRTFTVPAAWSGRRVQLHFGAVDWEAKVYVNRQLVGTHQGGYDGFSFDITSALAGGGGSNEIIVGVYDPTDAGGQPVGKQRNNPDGIFYTAASGIWQTVWMEPTPTASITRLDMTPDVAGSALRLTVRGTGLSGQTVEAVAFNGTTQVGSATGGVDGEIRIPVPSPKLWSPDSPFLYDLRVTLKSGSTVVDQVTSYFGMRSVGLKLVGGVLRPVLNGQFVFQLGTLDQGFWPDGIYTAPTDAALKFDIQKHKDLGFNLIRKHIKVEPQRWFYWTDKLGLLVWQDMPLMPLVNPSTTARAQFERELRELVDEHRSSPSIVTWVVQNEGWGQYDQARLADLVKGWDPSRLVDNMSGINCCGSVDGGNGDLADWHVYQGPGAPSPSATRASVLGEFGGLGMRVSGHEWSPGNGFGYGALYTTNAALTARYLELVAGQRSLMDNPGLSASVYTEITDVENEVNGLFTYDRSILKVDSAQVRAAHLALIDASKQLNNKGPLPTGQFRSLQVTTPGFTNRYLRHSESLGVTEVVNSASTGTLKLDATFKIVAGLADATCSSFESRNYPGSYLRHSASRIRRDARDGTALFDQDATFCARAALDGSGNVSLESKNKPGFYVRHRDSQVWVDALENTTSFRQDATWALASPWWKSGANVPVGSFQSFQVTSAGYTNRYLRHIDSVANTEVVDGASTPTLKQDATFRLVAGLAEGSCYSFESRNYPGSYLRHNSNRLRRDARDGTALFDQDATFCAQPGLSGTGVSFESFNFPGRFIRHYASQVWTATGYGTDWDSSTGFTADASWNIAAPWAP